MLWQLPGNNTAPLGQPTTPTAGKKTIKLNSTTLKIAKPGYNVDTATDDQVAFDSSNRPMKVIAGADVALNASGNTEYDTGITLGDEILADVHFYSGSTIFYPCNPTNFNFGPNYYFSGTKIIFTPRNGATRARFMIYLEDEVAPSSGSNKVWRQFNDGTQDVVQFLKPGSANPPRFSDIIIDTRWPAVQILDEGYFTVGNGQLTHVRSFDGSGMFPMVKYMTVHGAGAANGGAHWSSMVRVPFVKTMVVDDDYRGGDSSYCTLTSSAATFHTFKGNYADRYRDDDNPEDDYPYVTEYPPWPIVGIRYYVLGIPTP